MTSKAKPTKKKASAAEKPEANKSTQTKPKTTTELKEPSGANKRSSGTRIPIQLLVDYKADGSYLFDFCRDLGEGGVFIETKAPKDQGSHLELTFTIPDSKETLSTKGKVIWVQEPIKGRSDLVPGMGVQFEAFEQKERKKLEGFVARYSSKVSKNAS